MSDTIKSYNARIDSKKRITLRGARTEYYHVSEREDGTIVLSPRTLVHPDQIAEKAYEVISNRHRNSLDKLGE
jgi:hypothetical protein